MTRFPAKKNLDTASLYVQTRVAMGNGQTAHRRATLNNHATNVVLCLFPKRLDQHLRPPQEEQGGHTGVNYALRVNAKEAGFQVILMRAPDQRLQTSRPLPFPLLCLAYLSLRGFRWTVAIIRTIRMIVTNSFMASEGLRGFKVYIPTLHTTANPKEFSQSQRSGVFL